MPIEYQARVRATHTASDGSDSTNTGWTDWSALVATSKQPLVGWFIDDTPNYNQQIGRTFMMVDSTHSLASAVCVIDGGRINCPPRTLVSLDVHNPGGTSSVYTELSAGTQSSTSAAFNGRARSAPPPPVRVSGGDGKLYVGWAVPHTLRGGGCHRYSGYLEGFTVQYRKQNSDDSWPAWSDANAVTKAGQAGLYRVASYGGDSASVVWEVLEDGDTLAMAYYNQDRTYRGVLSFDDLDLSSFNVGDVVLVKPWLHFYHLVGGSNPNWTSGDFIDPAGFLGTFDSEYAAGRHVSEVGQHAVFVSREHTWTGLAAGTYQVRVAAVGDGSSDCHNGQHFHDDGRGFWSEARRVEVGSSQAPGMVTNAEMERTGGRVTVTWDQPSNDNGSDSWAMIRYRPVGSDPDGYEYTYIPGAPNPEWIGLHFHEVTRICGTTGDSWVLSGGSDPMVATAEAVQTCMEPAQGRLQR